MPSQIDLAAQKIAETLAPATRGASVLWRWATVEAVNADGTMDVTIGGTSVPSLTALLGAAGASVGDRVRVDYLGADAVVTGVVASEPGTESADLTRGSGASSWADGVVRRSGKVVTLTINDLKLSAALANGSNSGTVTTIPAGYLSPTIVRCAVVGSANLGSTFAVVGTTGNVVIQNRSGASIATGVTLSIAVTYVID